MIACMSMFTTLEFGCMFRVFNLCSICSGSIIKKTIKQTRFNVYLFAHCTLMLSKIVRRMMSDEKVHVWNGVHICSTSV